MGMGSAIQQIQQIQRQPTLGQTSQPQPVGGKGIFQSAGQAARQAAQRPQQPGNLTAGEAMGLPGYEGRVSPMQPGQTRHDYVHPMGSLPNAIPQRDLPRVQQAQPQTQPQPQPLGGKGLGQAVRQAQNQAQNQGFPAPPGMLMQTADINPITGMPSHGGMPPSYDPSMIQKLPAPPGPLQQLPPTATEPRGAFGQLGNYSGGISSLLSRIQQRNPERFQQIMQRRGMEIPQGDQMNQMMRPQVLPAAYPQGIK